MQSEKSFGSSSKRFFLTASKRSFCVVNSGGTSPIKQALKTKTPFPRTYQEFHFDIEGNDHKLPGQL